MATFKELQDLLADFLAIKTSERLAPSIRKLLINNARRSIMRRHSWRYCQTSSDVLLLSVPAGTYLLPIPTDFLEPISLSYTNQAGNVNYCEFLPVKEFDSRFPQPGRNTAGEPMKFTVLGSYYRFECPFSASSLQYSQRYYGLLPDLVNDSDTDSFTINLPDLVLYMALEESVIYGINDDRIPIFAQKAQQIFNEAIVVDVRSKSGRLESQ